MIRFHNPVYADFRTGTPYLFGSNDLPEVPYTNLKAINSPGGAGNYVSIGTPLNCYRTIPMVFMLKMKSSDKAADRLWYGYMDASMFGSGILTDTNGYPYFYIKASSVAYIQCKASFNVCDGKWHCVMVVFTGSSTSSGISIYVDNTLPTQTRTGTLSTNPIAPYSCSMFSASASYNPVGGRISELAIWRPGATIGTPWTADISQIHYGIGDLRKMRRGPLLERWWWCGDSDTPSILVRDRSISYNNVSGTASFNIVAINHGIIQGGVTVVNDSYSVGV